MFNLLQNASDDQTAIGACLLSIVSASFIVFLSFHLGPAGQKLRSKKLSEAGKEMPAPTGASPSMPRERAA